MELNNIYNMDCRDGIKKIPDESIKLICTDPPYFLGMTHNGQKGAWEDLAICKPFYMDLAKEFERVLAPDGEFYIFCDWRTYAFYYPIFADVLPVKNMIVWDKMAGAGNHYTFSHELIIYGAMSNINKKGSNIWSIPGYTNPTCRIREGEKLHPTQKPLEVVRKIIEDGSRPGDTVLDCFMGSGTTAIACRELGRNYIGFELADKYCSIAKKRVTAYELAYTD